MTAAVFLAWAEARPDRSRHELVGGRPVEMAAERVRHTLVKGDAFAAIRDAVRRTGLRCTAFTDGVTVVVDELDARRPDVALQCGGPVDPDGLTCDAPMLLVEVLSPSTGAVDVATKLAEYFSLTSVHHYVIIDPVRRRAVHHARRDGPDGEILTRIVRDGDTLAIDPPGISVVLADCFASLDALESGT